MGKRLDEIAAKHFPYRDGNTGILCAECSVVVPWPCDAALLLMHIARREQVQEPGTEG